MTDLEAMLVRIQTLLQFDGQWHARAVGSRSFSVGRTPEEAMRRALGLVEMPNQDLF